MSKDNALGSLIAKIAVTDEQTGVFTFNHFQNLLEAETGRSQRYGHALTVLAVHMDSSFEFETPDQIQEGAMVISAFADLLLDTVRKVDIVARRGVKDFVVGLPETDAEHAAMFVARFNKLLAKTTLGNRGAGEVTVSVGSATFPDHATEPQDLLTLAEGAMQIAASAGGNRFEQASAGGAGSDAMPLQ